MTGVTPGALLVALLLASATAPVAPLAGASDTVPRASAGREVLQGPVRAQVLRVLDGDTLEVRARIWVGQDIEIKVRLAGIDTPELRGRCERERELARQARELVRGATASGAVRLHFIQYGKFAGRVLARVETEDGRDLALALREAGLARAYDGGKRQAWCP